MAHRSVIPFGPQHPVLPEPLHLDLVIEDDRVIEAIPQIGFVHRGLEKLTEKRDMHQFGYIAERICGICAVGHSCGYASACERMLDIEVPGRVQYIRTILHELSRIHSHLLWLGLLADAFGFEALFYRSWTLREQILKIFESTCGGRVILSINEIGGLKHDIEDSELAGIVQTLDAMRPDYEALVHTFLDDDSCGERLHGVGVISKKDALDLSMVGPFGRASGVDYDVRMFGDGAYADLAAFEPVVATDGDCYARCQVRCAEVTQAMDIIKELVGKIPHDGIGGRTKLTPADGSSFQSLTFSLTHSIICITRWLAPPCFGPFKEPMAAEIAAYVSVPEEESTRVVKVELLPPPCSAWIIISRSRSFASSSLNFLSGRIDLKIDSAVECSGLMGWKYMLFLS